MSLLDTNPPAIEQGITEVLPWGVDFTAVLGTDTILSGACTLVDTANGAAVTLADAATVAGSQVVQIIRGSALTPGHTYILTATATVSANKVWSARAKVTAR